MKIPQKISIENAGVSTSNGQYLISNTNQNWFDGPNNNHIEKTVDGWFLVDGTLSEQTYMFENDFKKLHAVGDCILPIPNFSVHFDD